MTDKSHLVSVGWAWCSQTIHAASAGQENAFPSSHNQKPFPEQT